MRGGIQPGSRFAAVGLLLGLLAGCTATGPQAPPARELVLTAADMPGSWTKITEAPMEGTELRPEGCEPREGYYYVQEPTRNGSADRFNVYTAARVFASATDAAACFDRAVATINGQRGEGNATPASTGYGDAGLQWSDASGPTLMVLRKANVMWNVQVARYGDPAVSPTMDWMGERLLQKIGR